MANTQDERFIRHIKKFKLDELLLKIADITRNMYKNNQSVIEQHFKWHMGQYTNDCYQLITPWGLAEISYQAIINSNDYRHERLNDDNDIINLYNLYSEFNENVDAQTLESIDEEKTLILLLQMAQEQFWYQTPQAIVERFNRDYEIIKNMDSRLDTSMNLDEKFKEITGFNIDEYVKLGLVTFGIAFSQSDISDVMVDDKLLNKIPIATKENINKYIANYTCTYKEVREAIDLGKQALLIKPIISTSGGKLIISNMFNMSKIFSECVYWTLREYYRVSNSHDFVIHFGTCFEKYCESLFEYYMESDRYTKIEELNLEDKQADWIVDFEDYIMIIEQKSALININSKKFLGDYEGIYTYIDRNLVKAYKQLKTTDDNVKSRYNKPIIKVVLTYENLFIPEQYQRIVIEREKLDYGDNYMYWILNISELERLLAMYKKDKQTALDILREKIDLEKLHDPNGTRLELLYEKRNYRENEYMRKVKDHFAGIVSL
ncbi:MAG TPA: hypothetical protein DCP90_04160 [Clostridiales bacterium]|nr:MAG: hypothetical protein A2Y22_07395 [Clostridiales bacterium GWD2_32_59]HAN09789.1 hypothetical protein [Clostridiales bacterium]